MLLLEKKSRPHPRNRAAGVLTARKKEGEFFSTLRGSSRSRFLDLKKKGEEENSIMLLKERKREKKVFQERGEGKGRECLSPSPQRLTQQSGKQKAFLEEGKKEKGTDTSTFGRKDRRLLQLSK